MVGNRPCYVVPAVQYLETMMADPFELAQKFPAAPSYLIQLFLSDREKEKVGVSDIARRMQVSPSAVTQSLSRLQRNELLERHPARGFALTASGLDLARRCIARHYLVERMLVDTLGVAWDVADEQAGHLQAGLTEQMEKILSQRLGHPQTCPHGNPFPGSEREQEILSAPAITQLRVGDGGLFVRVTERGEMIPGLLHFCAEHSMRLGDRYAVLRSDDAGVTLEREGEELLIPSRFAGFVCVSPKKP